MKLVDVVMNVSRSIVMRESSKLASLLISIAMLRKSIDLKKTSTRCINRTRRRWRVKIVCGHVTEQQASDRAAKYRAEEKGARAAAAALKVCSLARHEESSACLALLLRLAGIK